MLLDLYWGSLLFSNFQIAIVLNENGGNKIPSNKKLNKLFFKAEEKKSVDKEPKVESKKKVDPVRRITRIVLTVCISIFIWYLFADRFAPYTDQARIKTLVVPLVPRVSGHLTEVKVRLHSIVKTDHRST